MTQEYVYEENWIRHFRFVGDWLQLRYYMCWIWTIVVHQVSAFDIHFEKQWSC
jgi:hypothetical protein